MDDFKILFSDRNFSNRDLSFNHLAEDSRPIYSYTNEIDAIWLRNLSENPKLYNGSCMEIIELRIGEKLEIDYSPIRYKTFLGLREILPQKGINPPPKIAAVGALIHNNDDYFFGNSDDNDLKLIGGIIEPKEKDFSIENELKREVFEEINIKPKDISLQNGLIIIEAYKTINLFIFNARLEMDTNELLEKFEQRSDDEITSLKIIPIKDIKERLWQTSRYFPLLTDIL